MNFENYCRRLDHFPPMILNEHLLRGWYFASSKNGYLRVQLKGMGIY